MPQPSPVSMVSREIPPLCPSGLAGSGKGGWQSGGWHRGAPQGRLQRPPKWGLRAHRNGCAGIFCCHNMTNPLLTDGVPHPCRVHPLHPSRRPLLGTNSRFPYARQHLFLPGRFASLNVNWVFLSFIINGRAGGVWGPSCHRESHGSSFARVPECGATCDGAVPTLGRVPQALWGHWGLHPALTSPPDIRVTPEVRE